MEEQLEQSKRRLHFCMALIGGWFGAYAILRFHHFASAVTVNFIEVFTSAVQENWIKALLRLGIVILYVFTIFLAACLSKRCKGDLRMWGILSDAAAACVLSVLPEHLSELGVYICIFAMGFQIACQQSFMALGQAKVSLLLACLRKIILLIPLIFILPHVVSDPVFGVFLAEPVSDILAATITTITFFARFDKILDQGAARV